MYSGGTKLPYYSMNLYLCGVMVVMVGPDGILPNVYGVQKPIDLLDLSASKHKIKCRRYCFIRFTSLAIIYLWDQEGPLKVRVLSESVEMLSSESCSLFSCSLFRCSRSSESCSLLNPFSLLLRESKLCKFIIKNLS